MQIRPMLKCTSAKYWQRSQDMRLMDTCRSWNAFAGKCVSKIWTCPVWLQLLPWIGLDTTSFQCVLHSARGWNRCWNCKRSACRIYMKLGIWTVSRLWRIQQLWFNVLSSLFNQRLEVLTFAPNTWPNCSINLLETKARVTSPNV